MVPEGWQELRLDEICSKKIVYGIVQAGEHVETGVPYIKSSDVGREIKTAGLSRTAPEIHRKFGRSSVHPGDIVFSLRGNTGSTSIVPDDLPEANLTQGTARLTVSNHYDTRFVRYMLGSNSIMRQVLAVAKGSTFTEVSLDALRKITLAAPPLPEQQKIAEILSTWDKAIETTEALLANARTQKRALMQSLLTGTRRFPGFEDHAWREVRLGDVLREVNKPVDWSDDELYRLVSVRRRSGGVFHREDLYGHQILTKTLKHAHAGDFLISKMQVVHGAMALVTPEFDGMQISGSYISLVSKDHTKLDIRFFDWLSRTQDMYRRAYQCSYGVHIEKMTFNFGLFLKEMVPMPSSVDEQNMIAGALDTAQAEEQWYEGEAERLRTEKKSLMQQLLTGKRRVVV